MPNDKNQSNDPQEVTEPGPVDSKSEIEIDPVASGSESVPEDQRVDPTKGPATYNPLSDRDPEEPPAA